MSYSNVQRRRATALALWVASIAWLAWGSDHPAAHRVLLAAAVAATVLAALAGHQLDDQEGSCRAFAAGYRQAQLDHATDR